jgi:asparagine synthase (glutamine-hydrolysing)
MCGIAGVVGEAPAPELIDAMTRCLEHRGPDHLGLWRSPTAQLGHTRLSILDLSEAGNQPMTLDPFTIVYNGEVYNSRPATP